MLFYSGHEKSRTQPIHHDWKWKLKTNIANLLYMPIQAWKRARIEPRDHGNAWVLCASLF